MKKLLFILSLFVALSCSNEVKLQEPVEKTKQEISIDPFLYPLIKEFVGEAIKRGKGLEITRLDSIGLKTIHVLPDSEMMGNLGYYSKEKGEIALNDFLYNDWLMLRTVLFHELFHALEIEHCDELGVHIMCAVKPGNFTYAYYLDPEVWEPLLDREFNKL